MDKQDFIQTGGVPLKAERLADMQNAYDIFNKLGFIIGSLAIITGCETIGSNTNPGYISINGEVLPFQGGGTLTRVRILETTSAKEFENGETKTLVRKRIAVFTSSFSNSFAWSSFKRGLQTSLIQGLLDQKAATTALNAATDRITNLEKVTAVFVDNGGIVPWGKPANTIPVGWVEWAPGKGRTLIGMDAGEGADPDYGYGVSGGDKTKNVSITIPISGYGNGGQADAGDAGKLLASSGSHEQEELLESVRKAGNTVTASGNVNVLSPYRIVQFIHYTG